ncbi:MAG: TetR family transcriptional regulator [Acidimicrobiia bacterium]|nr:MAG: TetR family transcriptional regulator [Acidimicrobiia bacterium]
MTEANAAGTRRRAAEPVRSRGATDVPTLRKRRTQEERSTATRAMLLTATIDCLVELGYASTTTTVIAERANVSRGAQLHHYPTKSALVAAALEHLAAELGRAFVQRTKALADTDERVDAAVDALWESYASPLFAAWVELAVAARTDPELRAELAPLEVRLRGSIRSVLSDLFAVELPDGRVEALLQATIYLLQGMAFERLVGTSGRRARRNFGAVLDLWKRFLREHLGHD